MSIHVMGASVDVLFALNMPSGCCFCHAVAGSGQLMSEFGLPCAAYELDSCASYLLAAHINLSGCGLVHHNIINKNVPVLADAHPFYYMMDHKAEAKRYDPEGNWVRRWLPVLARLPTQYIHR